MQKIQTIYVEEDAECYDRKVQKFLDAGYKLIHANTGLQLWSGGTCATLFYTAVLLKEG
jgi:hypothetical protein